MGDGKTVGSGTVVRNYHIEVAAGTTCWSHDGKNFTWYQWNWTTGHDTNENQGYDQKGYDNNVTLNMAQINNKKQQIVATWQ